MSMGNELRNQNSNTHLRDQQAEADRIFRNFIEYIQSPNMSDALTFGMVSYNPEDESYDFRSINIDEGLKQDLIYSVGNSLTSITDKFITLLKYDAGYTPSPGEYEWINFSTNNSINHTNSGNVISTSNTPNGPNNTTPNNDIVDYFHNFLNVIPEPVNILLFNHREVDFIDNLKFYVLILQTHDGTPVYLFYAKNKMKIFNTCHKLFASVTENRLTALEVPIFEFNEDIDCIAFGSRVFSIHKFNFQQIFGFYETLEESADDLIDCVNDTAPILNFTEFSEACKSDRRMLSKLRSIIRQPYISVITFEDIEDSIVRNNLQNDIEIVADANNNKQLVFDGSPRKRWIILKILDDDYLKSEMTTRLYESNSKRLCGS